MKNLTVHRRGRKQDSSATTTKVRHSTSSEICAEISQDGGACLPIGRRGVGTGGCSMRTANGNLTVHEINKRRRRLGHGAVISRAAC